MRYLLTALVLLACTTGCQYSSKPWKKGVAVPQHLYAYNAESLRDTIKAEGYEGEHPFRYKLGESFFDGDFEFFNVGRNAAGTKVIVRDLSATGPAFVFSPRAQTPEIVQNPHGTPYWLDEDGSIAAWEDADDKRRIHLAGGGTITSREGYSSRGFDPSGRYYFECVPGEGYVYVYDAGRAGSPLFEYITDNKVASVEFNDGRFHILEYGGPGWYLDTGVWKPGITQQFRVFDDTGRQIDRIQLPENRFVVDRDRWSDAILLTDDYDSMFAGAKYLFRADTGETINLGEISMGVPLFLSVDVLGTDQLTEYRAMAKAGGHTALAAK